MLLPDHPLAAAQVRAALASGWPTLHGFGADEAAIEAGLAVVEARLGACPQAELIVPWEAGEPWALRCDVPTLAPDAWPELALALGGAGLEATLTPGRLPGAREALDSEAVVADVIGGGGLEARAWSDVDTGLVEPDLVEEAAAPDAAPLASELVAALREVGVELVRHPAEAVAFVRHRPTGRRGVRLTVPASVVEGLGGDEVAALRRDVVAAIAAVGARRVDSAVAIAPDLLWEPRLGFSVLAWHTGARGPALPGDSVIEGGASPKAAALVAAVAELGRRVYGVEVQVVPLAASELDAVVDAAISAAEGTAAVAARPRWVPLRSGGAVVPAWAPTWRLGVDDVHDALVWLEALGDDPRVAAVRVVPTDPVGLEHAAPFLDPAWRWGGRRWIVRWRDGASDVDRVLGAIPRDPMPEDEAVMGPLLRALAAVPGALPPGPPARVLRPIVDLTGRTGFVLRWSPALTGQAWLLGWALGAVASADLPGITAVADLALPEDGPVLHLWRADGEEVAPEWVSVR